MLSLDESRLLVSSSVNFASFLGGIDFFDLGEDLRFEVACCFSFFVSFVVGFSSKLNVSDLTRIKKTFSCYFL